MREHIPQWGFFLLFWIGMALALFAPLARKASVPVGIGMAACGFGVAAIGGAFVVADITHVGAGWEDALKLAYVHLIAVPVALALYLGLDGFVPDPDIYAAVSIVAVAASFFCGLRALRNE